jgi:hypothetical protein
MIDVSKLNEDWWSPKNTTNAGAGGGGGMNIGPWNPTPVGGGMGGIIPTPTNWSSPYTEKGGVTGYRSDTGKPGGGGPLGGINAVPLNLTPPGGGGGGGGTNMGGNTTNAGTFTYDPSSYYPGYGQTQSYNYPKELGWASDVLGEYAYTGRPADWSPYYQQAKQAVNYDILDAINQAKEQAGLGGMRWSSPLGRSAQDIAARTMANLGTTYTQQQLGALENAANRGLTAAGMLPGVAQQYQQMPLDLSAALYNMGSGLQGAYQNMISPYYNEAMRMAQENNPWLQFGQQVSALPFQSVPQQYQQSFLSQLLGLGGTLGSSYLLGR